MTAGVEPVRELRERTGAGIMDCKSALQATNGDMEKAIDFLRKKGMASAAKRAGREAKEGLIGIQVNGSEALVAEVNCETDFVARTEDFKALLALALDETAASGENAVNSEKLAARVAELSGKIGEKILVRRTKKMKASGGALFSYIHSNQKLGVVIELASAKAESQKNAAFQQLGKDLAMQVAASNPLCLERSQVPVAAIEREKAIYREEVKGKPENIVEKILVRRTKKLKASGGALFSYIHSNQKLGVVVELASSRAESQKNAAFQQLGKDLAMQVAASNPLCLERSQVPAAAIEREKAVHREEVKGKPENIVEKILTGKLEKFYQGSCLIEQPFIKDDKQSVKALIEQVSKQVGDTLQLKQYVRFQLGESASA